MLVSGRVLIYSGGLSVICSVLEVIVQAFDMISAIYVIVFHGFPLVARKILSCRVERHLGMQVAGV